MGGNWDDNWREYGRRILENPARARHSFLVVVLCLMSGAFVAGFSIGILTGWLVS